VILFNCRDVYHQPTERETTTSEAQREALKHNLKLHKKILRKKTAEGHLRIRMVMFMHQARLPMKMSNSSIPATGIVLHLAIM